MKFEHSKTLFPQFDSDSDVPGAAELSDISDDDSVKRERYRTKEDQDVAVFLQLCKLMSMQQIVHLLQGHARTMNLPPQCLMYALPLTRASTQPSAKRSKPIPKIKKFRFAEVAEHKVRTVVHEVPSWKHIKSLWWSLEEQNQIRLESLQTVRYFRKHRPEYTKSVEIVAESYRATLAKSVVEDHMKKLTEDSFARGLETHIVRLLSSRRRDTVEAVLQEQNECRMCNDSYDISCQCLREQSLAYSVLSCTFAVRIAECDHVDALKASLSTWQVERAAI